MKLATIMAGMIPFVSVGLTKPLARDLLLPLDARAPFADKPTVYVHDGQVLEAFRAAGHPATTPYRTWEDDSGVTYQAAFTFDNDEWEVMRATLAANSSQATSANGHAERSSSLESRENPQYFFCDGMTDQPFAYAYTVSSVVGTICAGFAYAIELGGKKHVIERYDIADRFRAKTKMVFSYTWNFAKFGSVDACTTAINYGLQRACEVPKDGNKGNAPCTQGFSEDYKSGGSTEAHVEVHITKP